MKEKNYIQYFCDDTLDDISDEICSREFDLSN